MTLIGHWPLNDASGTVATALVGSNGTYVNAPTLRALGPGGVYPHAAKFAAASSQSATLPLTGITDPWSVAFWFASTDQTANLFDWRDGAGDGVLLSLSSGSLRADANAGNRTAAATVDDGLSHHCVLTYADGTATLYVDGVSDGTFAATDLAVAAATATLASGLDGRLSDVRAYSSALTPAEVLSIYEEARGPIAHYECDETSGTQLTDSSGNGLHLTTFNGGFDPATDSVLGPTGGDIATALEFSDATYPNCQSADNAFDEWNFGRAGETMTPLSVSCFFRLEGNIQDNINRINILGTRGVSDAFGLFRLGLRGLASQVNPTVEFRLCNGEEATNANIYVETSEGLQQGRWYHLCATHDGALNDANMRIYVNAVDQTSGGGNQSFAGFNSVGKVQATTFGLGARFGGDYGAPCRIARAKVWTRELSADEVFDEYLAGTGGGGPAPQTWDVTDAGQAFAYATGTTIAGSAATVSIDQAVSATSALPPSITAAAGGFSIDSAASGATALAPTIAASAATFATDAAVSATSALAPAMSAGTPPLTFATDSAVSSATAQPLAATGSASTWQTDTAQSQTTATPPSIGGAMGAWVVAAVQSAATAHTPTITSTAPAWDIPQAASQSTASEPTFRGSPATWQINQAVSLASAVEPGYVMGAAWAPDQAISHAIAVAGTFTGTGDLIAPESRRHVVAARTRIHIVRR